MGTTPRTGWAHRIRRLARWLRLTGLLFILLLLGAAIYLNRVGIPDFLRARLIGELQARGLDLQFSRLRLHWYRGIVAENINLGRTAQPFGPQLYLDRIELRLNPHALRHLDLQLDSLLLRHGRLVWPLAATNHSPRSLSIENLTAELRFLPNDRWELDRFEATFLGTRLEATATLTNASYARHWNLARATNRVTTANLQRLDDWLQTLQRIQFGSPPEVHLMLQADARDFTRFNARLIASAPDVAAPQARLRDALLIVRINQPFIANGQLHSKLLFKADRLRTPWLRAREARFTTDLAARADREGWVAADWHLQLDQPRARWGSADRLLADGHTRSATAAALGYDTTLQARVLPLRTGWGSARTAALTATVRHPPRALAPISLAGSLRLTGAQTRWGELDQLQLEAHWTRAATHSPARADASWGAWARFEPFQVDWQAVGDGFRSTRLTSRHAEVAGRWRAPDLALTRLQAALYGGSVSGTAQVNVATRQAGLHGQIDCDLHQAGTWLGPAAQRWLGQLLWNQPPSLQVQASLKLPPWSAPQPDWRGQVLPTVAAAGAFRVADAAFRGLTIDSAATRFTLTNLDWSLPDAMVKGPRGECELSYAGRLFSPDFHCTLEARLDPAALAPLLDERGRRALQLFEFHQPPWARGQVWGRWSAPERLGFAAQIAATNFVFRDETCRRFAASVRYTNGFVSATNVQIQHQDQSVSAPGVGFDVPRQWLYLTNAVGTVDPMVVARAIGPSTVRALEPYRFELPPHARVNGSLHVRAPETPDLRFELAGGPFRYWRFRLPQVATTVLWRKNWLILTNLDGEFYGGRLRGDAGFDLDAPREADFHFQAYVADASLKSLMDDIRSSTNRLEGALNGNLIITAANTADWQSWNGFGDVRLRDGYLWNLPMFGIFSPVLNAVVPGLGNSRFTEGSAAFTLTNSVIHTDRLEMHAAALRLYYKGTVDFQGRVNARAEASLLRDTWLVGQLFSMVFSPLTKLFEYKVTGTLEDPKSQPLYVPKLLLMPLHPFRTIKDLLLGPGSTNAPPAKSRSP
ncbi:MAG: hypothetical protein KGS61_03060 [Verrucomicrobia bacterium]|nr:hypothetical protein [Verrucomicrobiota bacterium]